VIYVRLAPGERSTPYVFKFVIFLKLKRQMVLNIYTHGWTNIPMFRERKMQTLLERTLRHKEILGNDAYVAGNMPMDLLTVGTPE
jgi:hypothetical protein